MKIHRLQIDYAGGGKLRILAARENEDGPYADFDVRAFHQGRRGELPVMAFEASIRRFARAAGVQALFASILQRVAEHSLAIAKYDETGQLIPMPEMTLDELRAMAKHHYDLSYAIAQEIWARTGTKPARSVKARCLGT